MPDSAGGPTRLTGLAAISYRFDAAILDHLTRDFTHLPAQPATAESA